MTGETTADDSARQLADDLSRVCGALAEIATTWRRASQTRPAIPVGVPARLQDKAGQLAADIRSPGQGRPVRPVAARLAALRDDIASAQAITCGPGISAVGDYALWDGLNTAMDRACGRLPGMVPLR